MVLEESSTNILNCQKDEQMEPRANMLSEAIQSNTIFLNNLQAYPESPIQ